MFDNFLVFLIHKTFLSYYWLVYKRSNFLVLFVKKKYPLSEMIVTLGKRSLSEIWCSSEKAKMHSTFVRKIVNSELWCPLFKMNSPYIAPCTMILINGSCSDEVMVSSNNLPYDSCKVKWHAYLWECRIPQYAVNDIDHLRGSAFDLLYCFQFHSNVLPLQVFLRAASSWHILMHASPDSRWSMLDVEPYRWYGKRSCLFI